MFSICNEKSRTWDGNWVHSWLTFRSKWIVHGDGDEDTDTDDDDYDDDDDDDGDDVDDDDVDDEDDDVDDDTCVGIWSARAMLCQLKLSSRASKAPCTPDSIRLLA